MELSTAKKFSFVSHKLPVDTFAVVQFEGTEGLFTSYRFEIDLVSTDGDIDLEAILGQTAAFTIYGKDADKPFHGIVAEFEQHHSFQGFFFYRAVLVPKFHLVGLTYNNQVFLDMSFPEILKQCLMDSGLNQNDFELRLQKDYPRKEYTCQYNEKHLTFISRWMEHLGIYYYFEQTDSGDKVIVTDSEVAHTPMPEGPAVTYFPLTGLDPQEEGVYSFICRQRMLPKSLKLKDYNYARPSLEIIGEADVLAHGQGEIFSYGEHFLTPEEAESTAKIRAEMFKCLEKQFIGESNTPVLRPGYVFELKQHYRAGFNQKYLTTQLHHQGSQAAAFTFDFKKIFPESEDRPFYRNNFTAIPKNVQFRPYLTIKPQKIHGSMTAEIDAAGTGQYAELDDKGRYKVILPFDLSGRKGGKASTYLRLAQPFAGPAEGFHFPLRKGTEVLLTFIDGDPDRPVISGAVPNAQTPSPVQKANQTSNVIKTSGNNTVTIEDLAENQRIHLQQACGNEIILQTKGREGEVCIRSFAGNEILMRGYGKDEKIVITDHSGNKITMQGIEGNEFIDIVDHGGNNIRMQGKKGAEQIKIEDKSGNFILMNGADGDNKGITIKDSFGNEIATNVKKETLTLTSPKPDNKLNSRAQITLGGTGSYKLVSDIQSSKIKGDSDTVTMGATSNTHLGASSTVFVGAKSTIAASENFAFDIGLSQRISLVLACTVNFVNVTATLTNVAATAANCSYTGLGINVSTITIRNDQTKMENGKLKLSKFDLITLC
ncbi:MAG: type VI secretion system tip protein VgrG [Deltaproteobacteria bacterium]|nr:type VI secretion system tip protein VgrG [Deltaproteobacteria bacterium]